MSALARPPIESLRPVASFAWVRLLLVAATLAADLILGAPTGAALPIVLAAAALPWSVAILALARRRPDRALLPFVAGGDFILLAAVEAAAPQTYAAVHFITLVFIAAHAHFQGPRRGILLAGAGSALLIAASIVRRPPLADNTLGLYEAVFAVACLATAAVIGELRGIETAGRLRARELSRRTIAGEDEVRRQVADFIHDGPVQELIGLDLLLQGAVRATERGDSARATDLIAQARQLAESNIHALRDEIVNLGPYAFEELSFEIAVERCIPVWRRRYGCIVTVDANIELEPHAANDLFRITQEAIGNACKHGESRRVRVTLEREGSAAVLRVTDNGKGFADVNPLGPHEPGHIGLASMRERSELLQGRLEIESEPGRTVVQVRVPLDVARARR